MKGVGSGPGSGAAPEAAPGAGTTAAAPRVLCCSACAHPITSDAHRIEHGGNHAHERLNPAGILYRFGCFARADGCSVIGAPTDEHSWFPGFTWQYARCSACLAHLGWYFVGEGTFFALILERLAEPS